MNRIMQIGSDESDDGQVSETFTNLGYCVKDCVIGRNDWDETELLILMYHRVA